MKYIILAILIAACGTEEQADPVLYTTCELTDGTVTSVTDSEITEANRLISDGQFHCEETDKGLRFAMCNESQEWIRIDKIVEYELAGFEPCKIQLGML